MSESNGTAVDVLEEWVRTTGWKLTPAALRHELQQSTNDEVVVDRLATLGDELRREGSAETHLPALLEQTVAFVRRHVVLGDVQADAVALWNAHTYVYDTGPATPYLHPYSPEPGSGKTTLLDVLELTARNALQADNLTEAVLFRMIDKKHPTLLFDEVDAVFGKKNSDSTEGIRQVLNSGYRKGKKAWRCVPPTHEAVGFDVFCPKATAGLNELPGTLAHRSIPIEMKPPRPTDSYEDLDHEEVAAEAEVLRGSLQLWADGAIDALLDRRLKPAKLPELDARGNEIWRPLFRIADLAGGEWPQRARRAALELSGGTRRHEDTSIGVKLLGHIRDLFVAERMSCRTLVDVLNAAEGLPYSAWSDGKGISTLSLGRKLAPYGVYAKPIRIDGEREGNGYELAQFTDAFLRYLPQIDLPNRYTGTTRMVEPDAGESKPVQEPLVPVSENGANPHGQRDVPVVPVSKSGATAGDGYWDSIVDTIASPDEEITWAETEAATLELQRRTGTYGHRIEDVIAEARRLRRAKRAEDVPF